MMMMLCQSGPPLLPKKVEVKDYFVDKVNVLVFRETVLIPLTVKQRGE